MDWLAVFLITYLLCGVARVHTDFTAHAVNQPAYVRQRRIDLSVLAALFWWRRQPRDEIVIVVALGFAILAAIYWLLGLLIASVSIRLAILLLLPATIFMTGTTRRYIK